MLSDWKWLQLHQIAVKCVKSTMCDDEELDNTVAGPRLQGERRAEWASWVFSPHCSLERPPAPPESSTRFTKCFALKPEVQVVTRPAETDAFTTPVEKGGGGATAIKANRPHYAHPERAFRQSQGKAYWAKDEMRVEIINTAVAHISAGAPSFCLDVSWYNKSSFVC